MADALLKIGGMGGITSGDVTASKQQVLRGYRTITSDSDDEIIEGTFPVTSDADARQEFWYYNDHSKDSYVTRIPEAAYIKYYNADGTQSWDPWIRIPRASVKNGINYHPELTIDTVTTCGERGQIPDRGDGAVVSYHQGREDWANRMWVLFKNGWYHRAPYDDGQGHIHEAFVYVTYEQLKNLFGIDGSKMLQNYGIAGVQGTITPRPNASMTTEIVNAHWTTPKKFGFRFPQGYYPNAGNYAPIVEVNYQDLANAIGVRADKMLNDTNILGTQGQIKIINTQDNNYRLNKSAAFGIDDWSDAHNPVFWIDFPHGNGFYCRNDNHPHICIDAVNLGTAGADSVLSGQTATSVNGVKFAGTIPRWICTTGDVISAVNNDGFAWDDTTGANRGRGIVTKIPNGQYIQGANYVFLPAPYVRSENIRAGVTMFGIPGSMPDYSAGRVVFNGATFDGTLLSGVANKHFFIQSEYIAQNLDDNYRYAGIYNGGININLTTSFPSLRNRKVGFMTSQTVNLTPFRTIVIDCRVTGNIKNNPIINLTAFVSPSWAIKRNGMDIGGSNVDGVVHVSKQYSYQSFPANNIGRITLDVSGINGQAILGFYAYANIASSSELFAGSVQVTKIEFLN